ncbi:hypothetical protein [Cohnella terricola]|uniref:Uncharacterized protein n=1 Tax=Cohnella terricola TaxID=1289167 RepID=A0A559JEH9_9BACL|nr:hypothetical protein [Cohnella terricola]TVX98275.1 hypothetical protein FPZ45_16385 [Cohnella terricola]
MSRVAGIVKTHLTDLWSWAMMPWLILGISFTVNVIIGASVGDKIETGGLSSIYVYMLVLGVGSVGQTFPFLIGFGARRKDYFLGTTATIALIGAGSVILLLILGYVERQTGYWGIELHFFNISYVTDGPLIQKFWVLFSMMLHFFFVGFAISSIYRKFGRDGLFFFFIAFGVAITFAVYLLSVFDRLRAVFDWFVDLTVLGLANGLFLLTLVYVGLSYLLLRKASF